jgi:hypothetical protein
METIFDSFVPSRALSVGGYIEVREN